MRPFKSLPLIVLVFAGFLLAACRSGEGPLIVNTSGESVRLVVHADDGETTEATLEDQAAAWTGKSGSRVTKIEIVAGARVWVLEGAELATPFGKDGATAFIVEQEGPRKLTLDEARILMQGR